ncbi:unnamed protein product, partial [Strongylus vulgaris]
MTDLLHKQTCVFEGGVLLDCDSPGMVDDVADILRNLYDNGLHEASWLVSRRGEEAPRAISRQNSLLTECTTVSRMIATQREICIMLAAPIFRDRVTRIDVPSSATFPFLCSLTRTGRRSLLIQEMLLNTGAPRLISHAPAEVFFHTRADADYVVLPCSAEGNPSPEITWFKNDIDV